MLRLIRKILKASSFVLNERGFISGIISAIGGALKSAPWIIPTVVSAGMQLLGGKKEEEQEPQWFVDPYTQKLRDIYQPRMEPSYFDIPETPLQTATSQRLLGRLGRTAEDIIPQFGAEAAKPYYEAHKARLEEDIFPGEREYLKDILQKEKVLTSTPGIEAQTQLRGEQARRLEEVSERLMYEDIARDIEATRIAENIIANTIQQGTMLGGMQRQWAQWPYIMSMGALTGARGLESVGYMPQQQPSLLSQLGGMGMDIGKTMLMSQMLKGGTNIWTGKPTEPA